MKRRRISKIDELHERTLILAQDLKNARDAGRIYPGHTLSARTMAKKLNESHGWKLSGDAGMRELINHGRSLKLPFGGDGKGYFWAKDSAEMGVVEQDLKSRIAKMSEALRGVQACRREMVQIEAELFKGGPPPEIKPLSAQEEKALEQSEAEYASVETGFLNPEG